MPLVAPVLLAAALLAASAAQAAPFAITYTGRISAPDPVYGEIFPELVVGEGYTLTLVFDNGSTTATHQTWTGAHLRCALFRMNDARTAAFAHRLASDPLWVAQGSVATDASGALTAVFSDLSTEPLGSNPAHYSTRGIAVDGYVDWSANAQNSVFYDTSWPRPRHLQDASGGVQMHPARWTAPLPFTGPCDADAVPPAGRPAATPVPTLGLPTLALLGLGTAAFGARRLRRKNS
ncbi:MAG: hypothetical protein R3E52_17380 [Burkholderiaceae bacterium]